MNLTPAPPILAMPLPVVPVTLVPAGKSFELPLTLLPPVPVPTTAVVEPQRRAVEAPILAWLAAIAPAASPAPAETRDQDPAKKPDEAPASLLAPMILLACPIPSAQPRASRAPASSVVETKSQPIADVGPCVPDAVIITAQPAPRETTSQIGAPTPAHETLAITRQLDLSRDTLWLDRLARDIVSVGTNEGRLRFELSPPALGRLEVDVERSHHGLNVQLTTHTETARAIISDAQPRLASELQALGVRVAETQVSADASRQHGGSRLQPAPALIEAAVETDPNPERPVARDGRFA